MVTSVWLASLPQGVRHKPCYPPQPSRPLLLPYIMTDAQIPPFWDNMQAQRTGHAARDRALTGQGDAGCGMID